MPPVASSTPCDGHVVARQAQPFVKHMEQHGRVHVAVNFGLSNCAMVEVNGGYVVIDTGSNVAEAQEVRQQFDQRVSGGPQAIIYTHFHHDHIAGVVAFHRPDMPIWAHARFLNEFEYMMSFPRASHVRAAKQFGYGLPVDQVITNGIGPPLRIEAGKLPTLLLPNNTFGDAKSLDLGGVHFELRLAPGESRDQIFIWLPEDRVLFAADNFYKAFPNLYALRGSRPRPVQDWIDSLDAMRRLDPAPEYLVLGHTEPVQGSDTIRGLLTDYRDGIAFVHDSVVRGFNAGKTPDELVHELQLPPHLRDHPYLQPLYGTLAGAIRGIYAGYVGWFDGNATNLEPMTARDLAPYVLERLGGRTGVFSTIREAQDKGDWRWASWLCDLLLAQDAGDRGVRRAKADALSALAATTPNPLMRNWYMTDAAMLRDQYTEPKRAPLNSETIKDIPIVQILRRLPQRLDPKWSRQLTMSVGFSFTDTGNQFTFLIRRGIGEIVDCLMPDTDLTLEMTETGFKSTVCRELIPLAREYLQGVKCIVPGNPMLSPFRQLYRVLRLMRCLQMP